jgi:glycosyltransferase involved in cell wall biosynthesis
MISVCIASYNGEKYIKAQLDSILCQISLSDEIIISDDSSSDNTLKIIKSYNDPRIKLFEGNVFHSPIFNFENALKKASGDFIFLSDQDDIWIENKVSTMMIELLSSDLVISDAYIVDNKGEIISKSFYKVNKSSSGIFSNLLNNSYLGCTMAFKSTFKPFILPFPSSIPMHDIWIGNVISFKGKVCFINDKLIKYRRHGGNASPTGEKSSYSFLYRISYRIRLIYTLLIRLIFK